MKSYINKHIGLTIALPAIVLSLLLAGTAHAQTTDASTTPGAPNTGAGGNATMNEVVLATSAAIAAGGFLYLIRKPEQEA